MPSSTAKRVVLYRFDRQPLEGIINPAGYLLAQGIELITTSGSLQLISYREAKALCFVLDYGGADLFSRHQFFERRPRVPGLWTRFTLLDGDQLDGILSHNLLEWPETGYLIAPPRPSASRQRVFLPRDALRGTELRGVVGASTAKAKRNEGDEQLEMFE